jgi:hypothetical protein
VVVLFCRHFSLHHNNINNSKQQNPACEEKEECVSFQWDPRGHSSCGRYCMTRSEFDRRFGPDGLPLTPVLIIVDDRRCREICTFETWPVSSSTCSAISPPDFGVTLAQFFPNTTGPFLSASTFPRLCNAGNLAYSAIQRNLVLV